MSKIYLKKLSSPISGGSLCLLSGPGLDGLYNRASRESGFLSFAGFLIKNQGPKRETLKVRMEIFGWIHLRILRTVRKFGI